MVQFRQSPRVANKIGMLSEDALAKVGAPSLPPHSVQAEQALIGALMLNNALYDQLGGMLSAEHFYVQLHAAVFAAMEHIINVRGVEANPMSIEAHLQASTFGKQGGLFPHLKAVFENVGFASDIRSLAEVIQTMYRRRQLIGLADAIKREAQGASTEEDTTGIISQAGEELYRLTATGTASTEHTARQSLRLVIEQAESAKRSGGGLTGVATGFDDIDKVLGGLQRSDFIVLGARPSMGKTSLLLNIALHAARRARDEEEGGVPVGIFSLEMSHGQLMQRMLAGEASLNSQHIGNGRLSNDHFSKLVSVAGPMGELPLWVDDAPALTMQQLHARARQMKRTHGIGLLIVDYLQLLSAPTHRGDFNRVQEVSVISRGLKQIARELDIPVLTASQLSRSLESRENKRPLLSDLRESGSIEQDADIVAFLFREEQYLNQQLGAGSEELSGGDQDRKKVMELRDRLAKAKGLTEFIIAKNRKGPTSTIRLLFEERTTTFHSFARAA